MSFWLPPESTRKPARGQAAGAARACLRKSVSRSFFVVSLKHMEKNRIKIIFLGIIVAVLVFLSFVLLKKPSHDRDWELGQERLPKIDIVGDDIEISDFRDFVWNGSGKAEPRYVSRKHKLSEIRSVDVIISHFSDFEGLAHIFLSFGFVDGKHVVVSMETRREVGEEFSPILGLLNNFEIIYVVGSERDIVGLRTDVRDERVHIYPTVASPEKAKELFLKLAEDINRIYAKPKFYNTLLSNCTNVITRRVEDISELKFPLTYKTLLPGYFDEVLYGMELIPAAGNFEEIKKCHQVDNGSVDYMAEGFEKKLRRPCD